MKAYITILLCVFISFSAFSQKQEEKETKKTSKTDGEVNYPKGLLEPDFDFNLKTTEKGKFILSFYKRDTKATIIKVYDITGNLILRESVSKKGAFSKEYDLSFYKNNFFVVEAGTSKYNKTKSVLAQ